MSDDTVYTWNMLSGAFNIVGDPAYMSAIQNAILQIANSNAGASNNPSLPSGKQLIQNLLAGSRGVITIRQADSDPTTLGTTIDIPTSPSDGFINGQGVLVQSDLDRDLFHELFHAITGQNDGSYGGSSYPNFSALNGKMHMMTFLGPRLSQRITSLRHFMQAIPPPWGAKSLITYLASQARAGTLRSYKTMQINLG